MDNKSENLNLKIIDEVIEEQSDTEQGFVIDSDEKAEWALRKISEEKAEIRRYINVCESMINEYKTKIERAQEEFQNKTSFLEGQLLKYFETVEYNATKTQKTYTLPSGKLKLRYLSPQYKRDDEQFLKWLKENSMQEFVKVEEKPNWAEFKKRTKVTGESLVTEDGQIVEGITVVQRDPVFEVDA